jgi:acyl carrier protein
MQTAEISEFIRARVAEYVACPVDQVRLDQAFADYGLDSVSAVSLCADIEDRLNVPVEPTLAWDYPTIGEMAVYLSGLTPAQAG